MLKISFSRIIFAGMLLLLGMSELVAVNCPICGGDGYVDLSKSFGMENVQIVNAKSELKSVFVSCSIVIGYSMSVNISLRNKGSDMARGYISIVFLDETGKALDEKLLSVRIPPGVQKYIAADLTLWTARYLKEYNLQVGIPSGHKITCTVCGGKSKITVLEWFVLASPIGSKLSEFA